MSKKKRQWIKRSWFLMAVLLAVPIGLGGGYLAWTSTDYTSWDTISYGDLSLGLTFVVHLRTDGPLTSNKDITIGSLQVLAYTAFNISRVTLFVQGEEEARLEIKCTKEFYYVERVEYNEFWDTDLCTGKVRFSLSGAQNMTVKVKTEPGGYFILKPSEAGESVFVLPKEVDSNWNSGRVAAFSLVAGTAFVAIPAGVKTIRDLYRDK